MKPSDNAALEVRSLSCGYAKKAVLTEANFALQAGEVVALIGPNGSGKSTLLNTLNGVLRSLGGDIFLLGSDATLMQPDARAKLVATVPQQESPAFEFSVKEMVLMARIPHSHGLFESAEDHEIAMECLEQVNASELADRPFTKLSGGEQQRVLLARALAQQAPILLLDEPSAHLDLHFQMEFVQMARKLAEGSGKTIIAAVHDLNLAFAISNRVLLLHEGRLAYNGTPAQLLESGRLEEVFGVKLTSFPISEQRQACLPLY